MRIIMFLVPQSRSLRPWMIFLRACSLSSGATASSRSRKMMSAWPLAAFSNSDGLDPGTASSERWRRGVACWIRVKLMLSISFRYQLTRGPEAGGNAIDGQQQSKLVALALRFGRGAAEPAQKLDLLAIDRVDHGKPLGQHLAMAREAGAD